MIELQIPEIQLTGEQQRLMEAELLLAAQEDRDPDPTAWLGEMRHPAWDAFPSPAANGHAPAGDDRDTFCAADLDGDDLAAHCREYVVPGTTKKLWIFPLSGRDVELMAAWARDSEWQVEAGDDAEAKAAKLQATLAHLQAVQVTLCCYRDPERRRRCFGRDDAAAIKKKLRYHVIRDICRISEELAIGEEAVGPQALSFFSQIRDWLVTLPGVSSTSKKFPPGWQEQGRKLLSEAQRWTLAGRSPSGGD